MEIGIDSFAAVYVSDEKLRGKESMEELDRLLERIVWADKLGIDSFAIGEHHREEYLDSANTLILAAAAALTKQIKLVSATTIVSAADPVRVFQQFATLDLLSKGRAEIVAGRGSFIDAFPLFGYSLNDYDQLFVEKLDLLLKIINEKEVTWSGNFRPSLDGQIVYPRSYQDKIPVWLGVGGTPSSFKRAGELGLPLMVAIIGGETHRFRPLVDLYRDSAYKAGHDVDSLTVGMHSLGYVAETTEQAIEEFYPGYQKAFTKIGIERGWGPVRREHFDSQTGPTGAFLIGSPEEVAEKILRHSEALGGISRVTFQMDSAGLTHQQLMNSFELIGTKVKPLIKTK